MSLSHNIRSNHGTDKRAERDYMPELAGATLQDSPRLSRLTLWLSAALLLVALIWASLAVLDEVTVGEGKAIPSSKVQVVQNLEGGIVTEIFVREGQMVEKGATLLRLDDTRFKSNKGESEADRYALTAQVERLSAEAEGRPFTLSDEVRAKAPQVAEDEIALYGSRQRRLASEKQTLNEQLRQKNQELAEFRSKVDQYRSAVALLQQETDMSAPLVSKGAISPVEILRLKQRTVEARGQLNATSLAIPRAEAAIAESASAMVPGCSAALRPSSSKMSIDAGKGSCLSRNTPSCACTQAKRIWVASGNMSGARRAVSRFCVVSPGLPSPILPSHAESAPSIWT